VFAGDDGSASELVMPPLFGKTVSETVEILTGYQVHFRLLGTGTVVEQWPPAGALLRKDDLCIIKLAISSAHSTVSADINATRK
jgi:hypothetical protein